MNQDGHRAPVSRCRWALIACVLVGTMPPWMVEARSGEQQIGTPPDVAREARDAAREDPPSALRVEDSDPELKAALRALETAPTASNHCRVAARYLALGISDIAVQHYTAALEVEPGYARALDARARIWRDLGLGGFGLGDAYRAVHHAPNAPETHNTLGTILEAVGELAGARDAYVRALRLDPYAWYAWNNLCHLTVRQGPGADLSSCLVARQLAPESAVVGNNLAVALAVAGSTADAIAALGPAPDEASRQYNTGIIYAAAGRLGEALEAFEAASRLRPGNRRDRRRVEEVRTLIESRERALEP